MTTAAVSTGLGTASVESNQVHYDPGSAYNYLAVGESATVVIDYSISDGEGGTSTSTATVTVTGTNDGPTAVADVATTAEDLSVLIDVLANDTDPDTTDVLSVTTADGHDRPWHGERREQPGPLRSGQRLQLPGGRRERDGGDRLLDQRRQRRHVDLDGDGDGDRHQRRPDRGCRHGDDGRGRLGPDRRACQRHRSGHHGRSERDRGGR